MRQFNVAGLIVALLVGAAVGQEEQAPQLPKPEKEHAWLQQLVGEWDSQVEMIMAPDQPPVKSKGTESVRAIGGFWVMAENKGDAFGQPFTGILTLGYSAENKHYVGTWVDSMTGYLWTYRGKLNAAGTKLTLDTEGPCADRPGELCKFRETLEIKSKDHKVFSSSLQMEDGTWVTFMTITYHRKK